MSFDRRLVIDTGILISAAIRPDSIPALAFEKALSQFDLCSSDETLDELKTVLLRRKFDRYISSTVRQEFLDEYRLHTQLFPVTITIADCRDAKDNTISRWRRLSTPSSSSPVTHTSPTCTPGAEFRSSHRAYSWRRAVSPDSSPGSGELSGPDPRIFIGSRGGHPYKRAPDYQ